MTRFMRHLLIGAAALVVAPPAPAETVVQDVTVTALIEAACTAASTTLSFGTYDPNSGTDLPGEAVIEIQDCTEGAVLSIELDGGLNQQGNDRHMKGGGDRLLRYNLYYTQPGARQAWGDGSPLGKPLPWTVSDFGSSPKVHGELPAGQRVPPGLYTDTVTITVNVEAQ